MEGTGVGRPVLWRCHLNSIACKVGDEKLRSGGRARAFPNIERFGSKVLVIGSSVEMALMRESVVGRCADGKEPLCRSKRFEALQFPLSSSHRLMGVFRPIVGPVTVNMFRGQRHVPEGRRIGPQLVRDQPARRNTLFLEQYLHQLFGRFRIAPALHQEIQNLALMIDGTPEPKAPPADNKTISSRCQQSLGRGRALRRLAAIVGPNFRNHRRIVS